VLRIIPNDNKLRYTATSHAFYLPHHVFVLLMILEVLLMFLILLSTWCKLSREPFLSWGYSNSFL